MRFILATTDFRYAGRPRPGFPLILDGSMEPAQPFHDYLHYRLLERGKPLDVKTWEAYGRRLWDFARFLQANGMTWNQPIVSHGQTVVRVYRDWQAHDLNLDRRTINDRVRIVADMYEWALQRGLIDRLPFTHEDVTVHGIQHDLAHVTGGTKTFRRPDVLLDEWEKEPAFLIAEQLKVARESIRSTSQRLLFDLMARVGLVHGGAPVCSQALEWRAWPATRPALACASRGRPRRSSRSQKPPTPARRQLPISRNLRTSAIQLRRRSRSLHHPRRAAPGRAP